MYLLKQIQSPSFATVFEPLEIFERGQKFRKAPLDQLNTYGWSFFFSVHRFRIVIIPDELLSQETREND